MKPLLRWSCALLFWLSAQLFAGADAFALNPKYAAALKRELLFIIKQNPKYVWGGSSELSGGLDCSGYMFLASRRAGIPGLIRTTANRMSCGLGGWAGKDIEPEIAQEMDLIFWTFRPNRPNGHVGALLLPLRKTTLKSNDRCIQNRFVCAHASFTGGVRVQELSGAFLTSISKIRRLTKGD